MSRHFAFKLKDDVVRGMTREQYYKANHWVRYAARYVEKSINWPVIDRAYTDTLMKGFAKFAYKELLNEQA